MTAIPPSVLCFATSDPTGGGGLQADVLTIASMGCHPLSVMCAVAIRDTRGMEDLALLDPDTVALQARAMLEDIPVRAFKLGMVGSVENLAAVVEVLVDYPEVPLVVESALSHPENDDPDGEDYITALVELAIPQATVLVAGRHEISALAGLNGDDEEDEEGEEEDEDEDVGCDEDAIASLLGLGVQYVLVTDAGGAGPQVVNMLYGPSGLVRTDAWERLPGHFLGSRATLSAALAAVLAQGMEVPEAVREAQEFTWQALSGGYRPGMGLAVPDRLFWARDEGQGDA